MSKLFNIGDEIELIHNPEYFGTVTKVKFGSRRDRGSKPYQWIYLDGSDIPCGNTSEMFQIRDQK